ncbi:MAG: protein translocase SEC61 complex subunit gamma [Candidatus Micrarchaeia archaeon]|jgi:protein translocase SEC61 complex gamma subunit
MYDVAGFVRQSIRVMNVATLPRKKEFDRIVKITGIGMVIVGLIGVMLSFLVNLV